VSAPPDADQRTLPASDKRKADFRKRGDVVRSRDLTTGATLAGGALGAALFAPRSLEIMQRFTRETLSDLGVAPTMLIGRAMVAVIDASLPAAIGALGVFLVVGMTQSGWPPPWKGIGFDLTRLANVQGLGEMFSPKAVLGRLLKSTAQIGVVVAAVVGAVSVEIRQTLHAPALDVAEVLMRMGAGIARTSLWGIGALMALALFDFLKTFRDHGARLRMTQEEWKRENREQEGDPHIKRRRRQRMRELARRRVSEAVRKADVVIVNPTEYAVALRYDRDEDRAPRVVAKGKGEAAARIRELAREAGVPIVPDIPLCRLIHKVVKEGQEIPPKLYNAVATILAYVYKLKHRRS
jgi:flagellar biosynthetic protein FlhB